LPRQVALFAVLDQEGVGKLADDCVSCSPYRVPIARLGAAQAAIASKAEGAKAETMRTTQAILLHRPKR
jgi:hypothetical protein